MMFPHTITIYHHSVENSEDKYNKTVLDGFYFNSAKGTAKDGKGAGNDNTATIISNVENARKYGTEWIIQPKDMVLLGEGKDITSFRELQNAFTVTGVAENVCGSEVDNIVITCK